MDNASPWFEDDTFWHTWSFSLFSKQRVAEAATEIAQILKLTELRPGAHVLDMPCGVGRHSIELARRGFRVTGVDRSEEFVMQAREKAGKEGLQVEFVHQDMRGFLRPNSFDAAINLGGSFGYFETPEEDRKLVESIFASLKSKGVFVLDSPGKEVIAKNFQARDWQEQDNAFLLNERTVSGDWEAVDGRWIVFREGTFHEARTRVRLYSAAELATLLRSCGFGSVRSYGSYEGTPYDNAARRLNVVARKDREETPSGVPPKA